VDNSKHTIEKTETDSKTNNSVTPGNDLELNDFKKICSSRCSICRSGILKEIHDFKKNGLKLAEIVTRVKENFNIELSTASLSRHFQSYYAYKTELATKIIKNDTLQEVTAQAVHLKKTVELLDIAYSKLLARFKANTYNIDISDLEKLAKIRYQILNGDNLDSADVAAIFQKASNKYGLNLQQGVLFKS